MKPRAMDPAAAQDSERWVEDGLRALREQAPSDESRRATLARLGLAVEPLAADRHGALPPLARPATGALRWWLAGILLGIVLVLLRRWLGR